MANDLDAVREGYMGLLKDVVLAAIDRREGVMHELCPPRFNGADEKELLKTLAKANQRIASLCDRMRLVERQAGGRIGVPAVINGDIPNPVRTVLAFLMARCLASWHHLLGNQHVLVQTSNVQRPNVHLGAPGSA